VYCKTPLSADSVNTFCAANLPASTSTSYRTHEHEHGQRLSVSDIDGGLSMKMKKANGNDPIDQSNTNGSILLTEPKFGAKGTGLHFFR